jgi:hypothetical protein
MLRVQIKALLDEVGLGSKPSFAATAKIDWKWHILPLPCASREGLKSGARRTFCGVKSQGGFFGYTVQDIETDL